MAEEIEDVEPKKPRKKTGRSAQKESVAVPAKTLGEIAADAKAEELDFTTNDEITKEAYVNDNGFSSRALVDAPEVVQIGLQPKELTLSKSAENWRKFLVDKKLTPEDFLAKYPTNKMRHFVQEIVDFNNKTGKFSI